MISKTQQRNSSAHPKLQRWLGGIVLGVVLGSGVSCRTVYDANRADPEELGQEGSLVFVRPDRYTILGTRSVRDYVEITYESSKRNTANLLTAQAGFRNRGGQRWYDRKGPDFTLSVKTSFYEEAVPGQGVKGAPVYVTPWRPLPLARGDTFHYEAICPVPAAKFYQITVSEFLEHQSSRR